MTKLGYAAAVMISGLERQLHLWLNDSLLGGRARRRGLKWLLPALLAVFVVFAAASCWRV